MLFPALVMQVGDKNARMWNDLPASVFSVFPSSYKPGLNKSFPTADTLTRLTTLRSRVAI